MGWLSSWFRAGARGKANPKRRTRTVRPTVSELETRAVPANIAANFINHGGAVLGTAQVEVVFLGQSSASDTALQTQVDNFMNTIVTSPLMDTLSQYDVIHGQVTGSVVLP